MKKLLWKGFYSSKKILLWGIYFVFALYIFNLVVTVEAIGAKFIFLLIGSSVLGFVILFEYLKKIYDRMVYTLVFDCDIPKAEEIKSRLIKKDLLKGFTRSIYIFDALLLLDKGEYHACLEHLTVHEKFFRSTYDYLFIYYHTQLHCYYFLDKTEQAEAVLTSLKKLKQLKKKQLSGLYSWHEIEGIEAYLQGRFRKSLAAFELVDQSRLNNRELTYLFYMKGISTLAAGNTAEGNRRLKEARTLGNTLHLSLKSGGEAQ